MVSIHEKITALLEQRHLKKRDLAKALGISPQTATDICKGRSAITLPHLQNLVAFFELRADFWLDSERVLPDPDDRAVRGAGRMDALARAGLLQVDDVERLVARVRTFLQDNRSSFLAKNPDLTADEKRVLGLADPAQGVVGRVAAE
jgi:transcriptional regulator with XRE-family HTH domain